MNALWTSLASDTATLVALGFAAALAIAAVVTVVALGRRAAKVATSLNTRLLSLLDAPPAPTLRSNERLLLRALQDMIVFVERKPTVRFVTRGLDDRAIEAASESMLEHGAGTWVLRIGEHLTAIALTLTFTLLGLVLTQDVTDAIRDNAGNGAASMRNEALVHAFAKMGGKFFISAVGLVGAVVFRWARDGALKRITLAVEGLIDSHRNAFVSLERQEHESSIRDRDALSAAIEKSTSRLEQALTSMKSIEVSVQEVGLQVSTHLGKLMKESIADELSRNIGELRVSTENIATRVEATLTDALNAQVQEILRGLEAVRTTVQDKAGGEVEALLERMQNFLTGGFQSAQGGMSAQMGALTEQLTQLVNQVAETSRRVTGEAGARSEEMQRQMQSLLERTNEVLNAMQSAQGHVGNAVDAAVAKTRTATAELDDQARRVEGSLERILAELQQALATTTTIVQQFGAQATSARELSRTTFDAAQRFATGSTAIQQAAAKFEENLSALRLSIEEQRKSQAEFARVVPESIGKVQDRLSAQTRELSSAWNELQGALSKSVATIGSELSEPIGNLGDYVASLAAALKDGVRK